MIRRPPGSTRTDTLFPYTTLFRSERWVAGFARGGVTWGRRVTPIIRSSTPLRSADGSLPSRLSAAFAVLLRLRPSDSASQGSQDRRSRRRHVGPQAARPPCYAARPRACVEGHRGLRKAAHYRCTGALRASDRLRPTSDKC